MSDDLSKKIVSKITEGLDRKQIFDELKHEDNHARLSFLLNNEALLKDKKKYQYFNLAAALLLAFMTVKKVMFAMEFGRFDLYWLASLVVPMINIYVLKKILKFHKTGYQFLFVLSILALFRPENRVFPEGYILIILIGLATFLHLKMFPAKEALEIPN